eukprot:9106950-Alexandrium_andersonii.AAC.1
MTMRLTAAFRHMSQCVLKRRKWVPAAFLDTDTPATEAAPAAAAATTVAGAEVAGSAAASG